MQALNTFPNNSGKQKFSKLIATAVPMPLNNIDTDQIIPARFLLSVTKSGYGENLFADWRYMADGKTPKQDFILNNPGYQGAEILLAGDNFGSGSSREHAVWALTQYGFRVIISTSFSDIFTNNAFGNGLLVIKVPKDILDRLMAEVTENPKFKITVNLQDQLISTLNGINYRFQISPYVKEKLLKGLDDIGYILEKTKKILAFEQKHDKYIFYKTK